MAVRGEEVALGNKKGRKELENGEKLGERGREDKRCNEGRRGRDRS